MAAFHSRDVLDKGMTPTTGGNVPMIIFSRILSDLSTECLPDASSIPISLTNLWELKLSPYSSLVNMSLNNISETTTELTIFAKQSNFILQSCTPMSNLLPIVTVAESLPQNAIFTCTSPPAKSEGSVEDEYLTMAVKHMRMELLAGSTAVSEVAARSAKIPTHKIKANIIVCDFGSPYQPALTSLSPAQISQLKVCGVLHSQLASDPAYQINGAVQVPPIVVSCPLHSTVYEQIISILQESKAVTSAVIFTQVSVNVSSDSVEFWSSLLQKYKCTLCVDTWGFASTFNIISTSPSQQHNTELHCMSTSARSDQEVVEAVARLCERGLSSSLILSMNIFCKIQWSAYGGCGYAYLLQTILPMLRSRLQQPRSVAICNTDANATTPTVGSAEGATAAMVHRIMNELVYGNAWALLSWRPAPPVVEIALQKITCYICGNKFIPGDHFSKFQFEYCSSACLTQHRKAGWK